jgi:hypothetical protein
MVKTKTAIKKQRNPIVSDQSINKEEVMALKDFRTALKTFDKGLVNNTVLAVAFVFNITTNLSASDYPPDTIFTSIPTASVPIPEYLETFTDPVFSGRVTRITGEPNDNRRHAYSRRQAWSCDGRYIATFGNYLMDGNTFDVLGKIHYLDEQRWASTEPNILYGMRGTGYKIFARLNVETGVKEDIYDFSRYEKVTIGNDEGNLSDDDGYVVITAKSGIDAVMFVVDISQKSIKHSKTFTGLWNDLDWASISAKGNFIIMKVRTPSKHIEICDSDFANQREFIPVSGHGDVGTDEDGSEIYCQFEFGDYNGENRRGIWKYRLPDGQRTRLLAGKYDGGHLSLRNLQRPGWCYMSTMKEGYRDVFALKLDGSGTVQRFAQHHSTGEPYQAEPQAVPSPCGTKVMFASDWDVTGGYISSYVAQFVGETSVAEAKSSYNISRNTETALVINYPTCWSSSELNSRKAYSLQGRTLVKKRAYPQGFGIIVESKNNENHIRGNNRR